MVLVHTNYAHNHGMKANWISTRSWKRGFGRGLERRDLQRLGKVAEGITLRFSEELHAQDGVNTHDEQDDDEGVGDRKDGLSDGGDDLANLVKPTEEAKHTECSEKTHTADGRCTLNGTCKV